MREDGQQVLCGISLLTAYLYVTQEEQRTNLTAKRTFQGEHLRGEGGCWAHARRGMEEWCRRVCGEGGVNKTVMHRAGSEETLRLYRETGI